MSGLRLGQAEVVKGGARVKILASDPSPTPPSQAARMDEPAELFRPRLIEFGEMRRETVVAARPFVREELVVGKQVGRRVERIDETVRRTEVEVEDLPPGSDGKRS